MKINLDLPQHLILMQEK